ncbi:MAG: RNA methyltransferase [Proteobacteria bacterium]|jgi:putative N6-adenine-specific DNA methylase|nr:MAG: RNA methyltransferase [Pseudomonadota bacterium]
MNAGNELEIFLVATPGLENALCDEVRAKGFAEAKPIVGGVTVKGNWREVWRANLELRGASRVLARIASFRALHLAQLDKRARKVPWEQFLRRDIPFRVEAACKSSRIYHSGAAKQRIERAIREELGAPASPDAEVCIKARIEDDLCTIAIDTSGEPLHKRGYKGAVSKAPMRETLAALFLQECGFNGREPVLDPMCGSGTFVIEAAEIAAGLKPGRLRRFAFEQLTTFDEAAWQELRQSGAVNKPAVRFYGSDKDAGAIAMSQANATRAGVSDFTEFRRLLLTEIEPPSGPPGLVIVNPPYGERIGEKERLKALYRSLGQTLLSRFSGWRVGLVTSDASLAQVTGLPFLPPGPPVSHGGIRIRLFQTRALP